ASPTELVTDFGGHAELHDPLFFYLHDAYETKVKPRFPGRENPFARGGSAWPLGPGNVPRDNNVERANPFLLRGCEPYAGTLPDGKRTLREHAGHDYLMSYWYARYHGLL